MPPPLCYNTTVGSLYGAFIQCLGAMSIGLLYTAIYLRGGNPWFVAIVHAITDFLGLFKSTFLVSDLSDIQQMDRLNRIGPYIFLPVALLLCAFLLRKKKQAAIFERPEKLRKQLNF